MLKDSPNIGTGTITIRDDPRVLPFGKFLRKTKINELPQLFNVLTGDMSLIGPRPQDIRCFEAFPIDMQDVVASVTPGLSGIGSIVFRDEEELMDEAGEPDRLYEQVIMPYKGALEAWYVENNSVTLYFRLIFATIFAVAAPKMINLRRLFPSLPQAPEGLESKLFG